MARLALPDVVNDGFGQFVSGLLDAGLGSVETPELELDGVNPQRKWAALQNDRRKRVQRVAPDVAQLKFLAAKADTDLEGRASLLSSAGHPSKFEPCAPFTPAGAEPHSVASC